MPRVLIIDDDPQLRTLLTRLLTSKGFEVSSAKNGVEGLAKAKANRPDLITLDIIMPDMDGFTVIQRLREDPVCGDVPIMILTALATPFARERAVDAGARTYVTKPFDNREMVHKIKALIACNDLFTAKTTPVNGSGLARIISVHSLSGGLGCTALAINLAVALDKMWHLPTLLLDGDFSGGQVAMSLKQTKGMSWSDVLRAVSKNSITQLLVDRTGDVDTGLHVLTAPSNPTHVDHFTPLIIDQSLGQFAERYEYIVIDLAHDFRESTLELLRRSEKILYLLTSDSVSLQLARKALNAYTVKGINPENVELVLVETRPKEPAAVSEIESIIGRRLLAFIPYSAKLNDASERGLPFIEAYPAHRISGLAKDLAFLLSKQTHRDSARHAPTPANSKPRPQRSFAGKNGTRQNGARQNGARQNGARQHGAHNGAGHSFLKRVGLAR